MTSSGTRICKPREIRGSSKNAGNHWIPGVDANLVREELSGMSYRVRIFSAFVTSRSCIFFFFFFLSMCILKMPDKTCVQKNVIKIGCCVLGTCHCADADAIRRNTVMHYCHLQEYCLMVICCVSVMQFTTSEEHLPEWIVFARQNGNITSSEEFFHRSEGGIACLLQL